LARANEIANTQMLFGINKLSIRLFIPFVSYSLFRRIFGNCAAADILSTGLKATADPETATLPSTSPMCASNRVSRLGHSCRAEVGQFSRAPKRCGCTWKATRPSAWLFPARKDPARPMNPSSVQKA
jgi:hypothetical protein